MTAQRRKLLLLGSLGGSAVGRGAAIAQDAAAGQQRDRAAPAAKSEDLRLAAAAVVKATAIVNGEVITQTDIDQRIALLAIASGQAVPEAEIDRAAPAGAAQPDRRNAPDPGRQGRGNRRQAGRHRPHRRARRGQCEADPRADGRAISPSNGSSIRTIRRQIEGEIAWRRLQSAKIESGVSVGDDEVKAVIDKLEAAKGTEEFRVGEIFLSANPANRDEVLGQRQQDPRRAAARAARSPAMRASIREASTAAVGGDLGWVRPEQLPDADRARSCARWRRTASRRRSRPGRLFDRRPARQAQGADRRSARRGAQPQAGVDQDSRRARRCPPANADGRALRRRRADDRRLRRRREARRGLQGRSGRVGPGQAEGASRRACRT